MINDQTRTGFDLEDRTLKYSKNILDLIRNVSKKPGNFELIDQLVRSSGSVGANYIEANESLGKKDFVMRLRISRKEAKESRYWLELIKHNNPELITASLVQESTELIKIFSRIIEKSVSNN